IAKREIVQPEGVSFLFKAWGVVPRIASCGLFAVIQLGGGVVPSLRHPPEKDFWNDVKTEKKLINKEVCMDIVWNLLDLDCNKYPSTFKATFDKNLKWMHWNFLTFHELKNSKRGLKRTQEHYLTSQNKHARFSDYEREVDESTSEDDSFLGDETEKDLKVMTFDEYMEWKLKMDVGLLMCSQQMALDFF
ncbi:26941_t:CDS:2, partial [Gigaspora margarita]